MQSNTNNSKLATYIQLKLELPQVFSGETNTIKTTNHRFLDFSFTKFHHTNHGDSWGPQLNIALDYDSGGFAFTSMQLDREAKTTDDLPMVWWYDSHTDRKSKATCVSAFRETDVLVGGAIWHTSQKKYVPAIVHLSTQGGNDLTADMLKYVYARPFIAGRQYYQAVGAIQYQYQDGSGDIDEVIWAAFESTNSFIIDIYTTGDSGSVEAMRSFQTQILSATDTSTFWYIKDMNVTLDTSTQAIRSMALVCEESVYQICLYSIANYDVSSDPPSVLSSTQYQFFSPQTVTDSLGLSSSLEFSLVGAKIYSEEGYFLVTTSQNGYLYKDQS